MPVKFIKADVTKAECGSYCVRFESGWSPTDGVVDSGESEILLSSYSSEAVVMEPGMGMGTVGGPLEKTELEKAHNSKKSTIFSRLKCFRCWKSRRRFRKR